MPSPRRFLALLAALALTACSESQKPAAGPPPPNVTVAKPTQRTVVDQDEYAEKIHGRGRHDRRIGQRERETANAEREIEECENRQCQQEHADDQELNDERRERGPET